MKTRILASFLSLIALVGFLFTSYSNAEAAKTVELVYAAGYPKSHVQVGTVAEEWMARINKATQGRVQMRGVYGGTLLTAVNTLDGIMKGTADTGAVLIGVTPGKLPLSSSLSATIDLNLGNKLDMRGIASISMALIEEFPEFNEEYQKLGITPLVWLPTVAYGIISMKPIRTVEDLRGKKIRTFGKYLPMLFEAGDAVPMAVAFGEIYTSLQTGVLDAAFTDPPAMFAAGRFHEVAKFVTLTGPKWGAACALCPGVYAINNKSFARISKADQGVVKKISREISLWAADLMAETGAEAVSSLESEGATIIRLSQSEVDKWHAKCPDWYALAAEGLDKRGLPGKKVMARYQELAEDYISGEWKGLE